MHLSPPVEPMLARSVTALPSSGGRPVLFEQKADGFRALVFTGPKPYLQSRRGADLGPAFPEITRAAAALGVEAVVDAELVVWHNGRLDFTALQHRARLRGARAEHAAREQPAHLITFDLLELSGTVLMDQPLHQRRSALENLFASLGLAAPWALCPQTADAATARTWLDPAWGAAGVEGLMIKESGSRYRSYGRELSDAERHALRCLTALDAVNCLAWGPDNGDAEVAARGRRGLDRLMREGRL
ncbi:ATP-dependent DNA ligase [Streptomyces sp. NPDC055254]